MHYYLVCYDVSDSKMVKKVHKICKNFGIPLQYSVFLCHLNEENREVLANKLAACMDIKTDQLMFVQLRETSQGKLSGSALRILGRKYELEPPPCWIFT